MISIPNESFAVAPQYRFPLIQSAPVRSKKTLASNLSKRLSRQSDSPRIEITSPDTSPLLNTGKLLPPPRPKFRNSSSRDSVEFEGLFFPGEEEEKEAAEASAAASRSEEKSGLMVPSDDFQEDPFGDDEVDFSGRFGFWLRRRRIDGALNRVPVGFYERIWCFLHDKNKGPRGLSMAGNVISDSLTQVPRKFNQNVSVAVYLQ